MYMVYWDFRLCTCALKYFSQVRIYIIWTNRFCALLGARTFQKNIERECKSALLGAARAPKNSTFGPVFGPVCTPLFTNGLLEEHSKKCVCTVCALRLEMRFEHPKQCSQKRTKLRLCNMCTHETQHVSCMGAHSPSASCAGPKLC